MREKRSGELPDANCGEIVKRWTVMTRVIAVAAALLALAVAAPAAHAVPGYEFADWIAADNGPVTGSLHGRAISFNGVTQTNANVYDGTYTKFDSDLFTPYSLDLTKRNLDASDEIRFLQKPFRPQALALAVRECLDA